jgi:hypothetical protein
MRALVSRVILTNRSTMRGNLPGLGMLSGWSVQSKVIGDSDQRRYSVTPQNFKFWNVTKIH